MYGRGQGVENGGRRARGFASVLATINSRPLYRAFCGYLLLTALFYAPILMGSHTFPDGDFTHHFLPFSLFQLEALRAGQLPVWNPYTYAGHPFLADTQAAVFYPVSNLLLALTEPWTGVGARLYFLQVEAALQVALAGFFVYLLVRDLTQSEFAAFTSGCCFAFSGYLTGYPPLQLAILRTAIWLPLILWLLGRAFASPGRWRWWIGAACAYATAFFAGHPQTFLHISYVVMAYCVVRNAWVGWTQQATSSFAAKLIGVCAFFVLTLALSAAQWLPSLEFAQLSVRANVDYGFVSGGFPLQDTWQLLLPSVLTQFSPLYVGVVGLGLGVLGIGEWGVASNLKPQSPIPNPQSLIFFFLLTLISLFLSYGDHAPLYPLFYHFAPGWNLFRGQERAAFLVVFGLSVLAGYGAAALPHMGLRLRRWLALLFLGLVAAGVYSFGLLWQLLGRSAVGQWHYLWIALVTLTLATAMTVLLRVEGWSQQRSLMVTALLILNLFWANFTTNLDRFSPTRKTILAPEMAALQEAVASRSEAKIGLPGRTYNEFRVYEDYGMRLHLEDVWGSSPLRLARYAQLFANFPLDRMWRLTGVEHLLTWRRELFEPSELLAEFPQTQDTTYLHRLVDPNPRAWLVRRVQAASDEEAVRLLADHAVDLDEVALLPPEARAMAKMEPAPGKSEVELNRLTANRLSVAVQSEQGGLLVISENWMPGWRIANAKCRDQRAPENAECTTSQSPSANLQALTVYRTNLTLIGVAVPPGAVRFELVYWPASVRNGLWISGTTLLILLVVIVWRSWQRAQGAGG